MSKQNPVEALNVYVADLANRAKLDTWCAFIEDIKVPAELVPAFMTGRGDLVKLVRTDRPYSPEEVQTLLAVIGGLLETNNALREHAQEVAHLVRNWSSAFSTLRTVGGKIEAFANFRHFEAAEEE